MRFKKRFLALILVVIMAISSNTMCYAAGKTIGAYKCDVFSDQSDCTAMVNGIRNEVPAYTGVLKIAQNGSTITINDFKDKTKAIKYWSSHGGRNGLITHRTH